MTGRSQMRFTVDLAELESQVEQMAAFESVIEQALARAEQVVTRLHLTWSGQAAAAHTEAHRQWADGLTEMREGLALVRAAAARAHGNYTRAAQTNASMWSSVR